MKSLDSVSDKQVFDTSRTEYLGKVGKPSQFFNDDKNYRLVQMTPNEYFKLVANELKVSPDELIKNREKNADKMSIEEMQKKMSKGEKFDTPWLRLNDYGDYHKPYFQEGLHRMLSAGKLYGMDTKQPVYLATESEDYNDLSDKDIDTFIKDMNKKRNDNYVARQKQEELKKKMRLEQDTRDTAEWFKIDISQVTPELIKQYNKELDEMLEGW